jgi:RNA polymerase sigma-70 factor (ECF subfamily)
MRGAGFHSTRWSLVARVRDADRVTAQRALGELCEIYWHPLYAFLRGRGSREDEALDVVQAFCAQLLERGLGGAAPAGPFRAYLLGALRHFADNHARHERAQKRGGGAATWSWDLAEERYAAQPADHASPERLFERRWALALLDRAATRVRDEYASKNRQTLFAALEPALLGDPSQAPHAAIARTLGSTEGAVKVALHRLRARMRELIRDEVAQTLVDPAAIDDELRFLFDALGR